MVKRRPDGLRMRRAEAAELTNCFLSSSLFVMNLRVRMVQVLSDMVTGCSLNTGPQRGRPDAPGPAMPPAGVAMATTKMWGAAVERFRSSRSVQASEENSLIERHTDEPGAPDDASRSLMENTALD